MKKKRFFLNSLFWDFDLDCQVFYLLFFGEERDKMNMMRRLKSIASGRSSVSDPVIFFNFCLVFCTWIFVLIISFIFLLGIVDKKKIVRVAQHNKQKPKIK